MGNIVLLDDLTINKIAAGEVIERPASVVKELMENSIDAGATSITTEIKNGGITYIRITDNGKGILPDDMEIAFERHATSKIRSAKDLEIVKSMGFRGEALASIAAIAHVELMSRTEDRELGYKIVIEGGNVISKEIVGCPKGTTIIVENLFFNTPVRYKFLKKDFTETGYVEDAVTRIALVNQNVAVKLINSGKTIMQTNGNGNIKDCVYSIFGKDIAENIINVDYKFEDMSIKGCIGRPLIAKSNRSSQLFFVNNRFVKDKVLTSAAEQAFKGMIAPGKYGFLILNVEIDPHQIDVNVHPAKLEIRFQEENKVFKLVYHAIKEALLSEDYLRRNLNNSVNNESVDKNFMGNNIGKENYNDHKIESRNPFSDMLEKMANDNNVNNNDQENQSKENVVDEKNNEDSAEVDNSQNETEQKESKHRYSTSEIPIIHETGNLVEDVYNYNLINSMVKEDKENQEKNIANEKSEEYDETFEEMYEKTFGKSIVSNKEKVEVKNDNQVVKNDIPVETAEHVSLFEDKSVRSSIKYKFIGIAFSTYIVIEIDSELYIIDQQSAHERILYEKIKKNYYSDSDKDCQLMLLPDIITLTPKEMSIAKDNMLLFKNAGFEVEEFGENTIKLSGVPNICLDLDTKELFIESLDEINTVARTAKQEIEEKFIATIASKVAVKAKTALTFEEVDSLMQDLLVLDNPFTCPNGKTIAIKLSQYEIEKKFSRK